MAKYKQNETRTSRDNMFKLTVVDWQGSFLVKVDEFHDTLEKAKAAAKHKSGKVKIYNCNDEVVHVEHNEYLMEHYPNYPLHDPRNPHHPNHNPHHHEDDDDELYA